MKIDLGRKSESLEPCCAPETKNDVHYPTLWVSGDAAKDLKDIPEEGVMKIRYKRVGLSVSERDGKKDCSVDLEVREVLGARGLEETKRSRESELDSLAKELGSY